MAVDERDYCQNPVPPGVAIAHATGDRHNGTVRTDACWASSFTISLTLDLLGVRSSSVTTEKQRLICARLLQCFSR